MKKIVTLLFCTIILLIHAQPTKILWIGNSYTSVNNLPLLFHDLALSGGDSVIYDGSLAGGFTFNSQSTYAPTIQKIYSQQWDYVVLQGQSQEPSFPPFQVQTETFPYAAKLDSLIHDNDSCTQTVFYMTWGKKYGDQSNCAGYPVLCTFDGVTDRLRDSYLQMANDNHALTAPAGMAWHASWHTDTLINLWQSDNSHPNMAGSYLTACVFYSTIFRKSPVGLSYVPSSIQANKNYLQNIAYHTVFDSLSTWNIGAFDVKSNFDYTGGEATKTYSFNNLSANSTFYQWNFGDGSFSDTGSIHTYSDTGTYTVTLTSFGTCGKIDSSSQTITIHEIVSGISGAEDRIIEVFPNPVKEEFTIYGLSITGSSNRLEIYDITGEKMLEIFPSTETITIKTVNWKPGIYLLKINGGIRKLVKL